MIGSWASLTGAGFGASSFITGAGATGADCFSLVS